MRKTFIILFSLIVIGCTSAASWWFYQHNESQKSSERLVEDTIRILIELNEARTFSIDSSKPLVIAYTFQQHITNAEELIRPWRSDQDPDRAAVVAALSSALSEYDAAAKAYILNMKSLNDEASAVVNVKLKSADDKIQDVYVPIRNQPHLLSADAKARLADYIGRVFEKELGQLRAGSKTGTAYAPVWTAISIRQLLLRDQ